MRTAGEDSRRITAKELHENGGHFPQDVYADGLRRDVEAVEKAGRL